jgi:hypothetical protein
MCQIGGNTKALLHADFKEGPKTQFADAPRQNIVFEFLC